VSEQKDLRRIVSSSAYLLFYRRRSPYPLGGPRFNEIFNRYDNLPEPSEDGTDSGEDQRLGGDSSLHGSSSASIGVGAAHPAGGLGGGMMKRSLNQLASGGVALPNSTTINPAHLEKLPSYQDALEYEDAAPLLAEDAVMNDGLDVQDEDEGIDMNFNNLSSGRQGSLLSSTWNFSHLNNLDTGSSTRVNPSGHNSDIDLEDLDGRSDLVQNNSSASDGSRERRNEEFDDAEPDEDWTPPDPVPDVSEEDQLAIMDLHGELLALNKTKRYDDMDMEMEVKVPPEVSDDSIEDEAAEIHVEEGEGLKMG
jgi:ubiquitin carboxyl-terminal hydrolase 4/11/15